MIQSTLQSCTLMTLLIGALGCGGAQEANHGPQRPAADSSVSISAESSKPTAQVAPQSEATLRTDAILIGLDADMSSGGAQAGQAIHRGVQMALHEINARGGLLGRPVECVVRDHRGNPARGIDHVDEFASMEHLVAIVGGMHTPVVLEELPTIHTHGVVYLVPWAAGTPIIDNGYEPNFVFRVSVRDEHAGEFLVEQALRRGFRKPGLLLENTGWGSSNQIALDEALEAHGNKAVGVEWFHWGEQNFRPKLQAMVSRGADCLIFVGNATEGQALMRGLLSDETLRYLPVISHWGITGLPFADAVGPELAQVDLSFLQTFSFLDPPFPERAQAAVDLYTELFPEARAAKDIVSPTGTAHAYDLVRMLALAVEQAQSIEGEAVRQALQELRRFEGLIRNYEAPFAHGRQDALDASDYRLGRYATDGSIVPTVLPE